MPSSDHSVPPARPRQSSALVIGASSLGTIFEWYEFYLYGLLATIDDDGADRTTSRAARSRTAAGSAVRPPSAITLQ